MEINAVFGSSGTFYVSDSVYWYPDARIAASILQKKALILWKNQKFILFLVFFSILEVSDVRNVSQTIFIE